MSRHARMTAAVAFVAALTSAVAPLGVTPAVAADAPPALTIPVEKSLDPNAAKVPVAGASGFIRGDHNGGYTHVSYADGSQTPYDAKGAHSLHSTGSDTVARWHPQQKQVVLQDMKGGHERTIVVPEGQSFRHVLGETVITSEFKDGRSVAVHQLALVDGVRTDRTLTGLPEDTTIVGSNGLADTYGFFVSYLHGGNASVGYVDRSFRLHPTPFKGTGLVGRAQLSGRHLVELPVDGLVKIWDVTDWSAPAHELPVDRAGGAAFTVMGDDLLVSRPVEEAAFRTVSAVPLAGGAERVVLDRVVGTVPGAGRVDGRALFVRAGEGTERSVHSVREDAAGDPQATKVVDIPLVGTRTVRLAAAQGELHTVDRVPYNTAKVRSTALTVNGELSAEKRTERGENSYQFYGGCDPYWCPELRPTGDGRLVFEEVNGVGLYIVGPDQQLPGTNIPNVYLSDDLEASGRYAAYSVGHVEHEVIDLDSRTRVFGRDIGFRATSLVGGTLWIEGTAAGIVDAVDVRTGKTLRSVDVGTCDLQDVQVWSSSVYWKCAGTAGVYDMNTKRNVSLPAHRSAVLGDGYVGWEQGGVLSITDVRGTAGTRVVGKPAAVEPGRGWNVDRFGGHLTYVDPAGDTHVVPSGVANSALSLLDSDAAVSVNVKGGVWKPRWWLSKPAGSWSLVLRHKASGVVVRTLSGGEARGLVSGSWDGKDASGRLVANGAYTWSLSAKPADGQGAELKASGAVSVRGGSPVWRDLGDDGFGELLVKDSAGLVSQYRGNGTGGVSSRQAGGTFSASAHLVPFGDVDGDRCNDVLVRLGTELRVYRPGCGKVVSPSSP
ncbi:FlgD immunoglobulin-like domain containing protein, partial [Streptomyces sp. NPDC096176]|uniref:FlgD immunoglobulin-like domain containing protein n=1 Tax=Streptomyces sp. NPDC096176 TaxID=3366079 RepID=UPI003810B480